ncbi:MAG: histone deacetylase [Candidatus Omnitrophota bacterium]|jgi:acetoin utilization deacetylase AcuC-like enzyme|nr:MAG: histone deacetylase [Candidatus Omnitrophota bacterium]
MTNQSEFRIYYSEKFKDHDTGKHPENARRMDAITKALRENLPADSLQWAEPRLATIDELQLVHTNAYIRQIQSLAESGGGHSDPDTVVSPASYAIARLSAGALLSAVDFVCGKEGKRAFVVSRPPGHHAFPHKSMGFCIFNNVAIAAKYAQNKRQIKNILILDWDVHHGNGTQAIFYEDDSVFYLSTHQYPHYPGTGSASEKGKGKGEGFTLNLPFSAYTPAEQIVDAVTQALDAIVPEYKPQLILISAGFDSHKDDYLGNWLLLDEDFATLTNAVLKHAAASAGGKVASCLEGGYNLKTLADSCVVHGKGMMKGY